VLLAIETATRCVGCALWGEDGLVGTFALVAGKRHAEVLLPAVDELCRQASVPVAAIDAVAADVGPGLFTGLRVGLATAKAISMARRLPSVGVTSLEALAHPHRCCPGLVASVVDARRGEVFWSLYRSDGHAYEELQGPAAGSPDQVAAEIGRLWKVTGSDLPLLAVGDGAWRNGPLLRALGAEVAGGSDLWPSPAAVAELAAGRLARDDETAQKGSLEPLYLRAADVRIGWEEIGGRVGGGAS